jgi:D-alanyl-D-alanine carboxypeptidase (penicillin-binding protein 5/6)
MASLTKMVVALVVLEAHPLGEADEGDEITFTARDVANYREEMATGGSFAPVTDGLVLTQRQALTAMLLPSANNYAESLAVWGYGSSEAYLAAAAAWLDAHGLRDTVVADLSGLSAKSVSTPADLVEIGKLVEGNPALASIVAQPTATLPGAGIVTNTNQLLGSYGIDGIKTGTTFAAGACLLFSTDLTIGDETVTVIGVVLSGTTQSEVRVAVTALIDTVKAGFHDVQLTEAGTAYGEYTTEWGQASSLVAAEAASALVWSDTPVTGVATADPASLGLAGDDVGTVDFLVGDETISVPLELDTTLSDPGLGWRVSHPGELFGW